MTVILITCGRNQEDHGSKPAWINSLWDPILKILSMKCVSGVTQGLDAEFKPQYWKKTSQMELQIMQYGYSIILSNQSNPE
jgi:hypothetical protein